MAATKISDVVVPEVFNPYVIQRTAEVFKLYMGNIIGIDPKFNILATAGGKLINMPFWNDLTGDDEVLSDATPLTVNPITTGQDIAALFMRGKAWGANDLAKALAGDDPMAAIASLVANYKFRKLQTLLVKILNGVIADNVANDSGDMVHDIAIEDGDNSDETNWIGSDAVVDAITGTMGDAYDRLSGMCMHSTVFATLQKQNQIVYLDSAGAVVTVPQGKAPADGEIVIPTYLGKRVLVDDNMPAVAGSTSGYKYTTYIFGPEAVAFGDGSAPVPTETDRDSLQGDDILVHRWHVILHPRGIAFQSGSVAGASPTNAEAALAANWDRVWDRKNVRIAALVTNK